MDRSNPPRSCTAVCALLASLLAAAWIPAVAWGQSASPRTPWGAPDLNGIWSHGTATPLERPEEQGERGLLTEAEIAEINAAQRSAEGVGARRVVWWERSLSDGRTSMIVDPPDGRIPYSAAGLERVRSRPGQTTEGPEGRSPQERCISYGIPRLGGPYSQNIHIAQTPDHVLLLFEMVHEFRIIPLDGRSHLPGHMRQWLGDSRGRWEDDSLVVETVNFSPAQWFRGLVAGGHAPGRALHPHRRRCGALRGDLPRSGPLDAAVDGGRFSCRRPRATCSSSPATKGNTGMTATLEIAKLGGSRGGRGAVGRCSCAARMLRGRRSLFDSDRSRLRRVVPCAAGVEGAIPLRRTAARLWFTRASAGTRRVRCPVAPGPGKSRRCTARAAPQGGLQLPPTQIFGPLRRPSHPR